jgi:hypothetical protein
MSYDETENTIDLAHHHTSELVDLYVFQRWRNSARQTSSLALSRPACLHQLGEALPRDSHSTNYFKRRPETSLGGSCDLN